MPIITEPGHLFQRLEEGETATRDGGSLLVGKTGPVPFPGPQGYLARVAPTHDVGSHFHKVDQFQVMFGAPGAFYQRSQIPRVLVHYADAYSVYGPFGAGPEEEFFFFTLRAAQSTLHGAMPEMRDQLAYRGERQFRVDIEPLLNSPAPTSGMSVDTLFGPDSDGLAAHLVRLAPGATATPPEGELRTGRYTVGIEGEFDVDGKTYTERSLGWSQGEIDDVTVTAGPMGAAVLFLHLPYPSTPVAHEAAVARN
jgi:hypothetical protein